MYPASGNRGEGAKNEAETVDVGFACDRTERQEFARYEAIQVCEVERNSPLLFPLGEAQKMRPKPWISEQHRDMSWQSVVSRCTDFARYEARSRTEERGEIRRLCTPRERESGRGRKK